MSPKHYQATPTFAELYSHPPLPFIGSSTDLTKAKTGLASFECQEQSIASYGPPKVTTSEGTMLQSQSFPL